MIIITSLDCSHTLKYVCTPLLLETENSPPLHNSSGRSWADLKKTAHFRAVLILIYRETLLLQGFNSLLESETSVCILWVKDGEFCRNCIYAHMWVFSWEKELKLHNHNHLDCLRSALKWLRKLYNLSLLGQEQRNIGVEGKTGCSWNLNRAEDTFAPVPYETEDTPHQIHTVTIRNSRKEL